LGNASTWIADAVAAGYATGSTPQVGALAVWTGQNHVAFVESVSGSTITVTECNNTPKTGANIVVGGAYARLRSTKDASSAGNILWTMPEFTVMSALSGPSTVVNGYQWVQLTGNGYTGYVAWLDLVPSQPATPTGLQWNITQFQNSPGSPWITSASPTYIYLGSQPPVAIIFATSPAGLQVTVDGTTYTTPMTFNWVPSSQHTLSVPTPQYFGLYSRYVFNGTQNQTITTPSSSYTFTANLTTQYDLTMAAGTGGSVSPIGGWYDSGSVVAIGATPNGGYSFSSWTGSGTGSYSGTANSTSVTMNAPIFETANFTANPQTGSLQVTISPAGAISAGAQWQVDGGAWQSSGATVSGLAVGSGHTLSFNTISGWTTPASQTPTIVANQTTTATGAYVVIPQTGSLQVTLNPAGAISAGAQWQVDGDAWQSSGATVSGLAVGSGHTLSFNTISGWTTPASQTPTIVANQTATATGTYVVITQTGSLQVTLSPAGAISAGAQWQVDSGAWQNSGATVSGLAVGSGHTLAFKAITGWTTPGSQTPTINANQTTTATGTYVVIPQTGSLQVTITPAGAVSAGAQWQVDGGAWQSSGATVAGLAVGSGHTLAFNTVSGWTTPGSQTPTIVANQTTTATGTYAAVVSNPPQLSACSVSNGVFHFTLNGPVGTNYAIEVSSNLVNWTILSTNTIPANGAANITNPVQPNWLRRFYRAVPFGTNIVFSDSFSGNIINASKWTTSGSTVLQSTNTMEVLTTATDAGGNLTSVAFPVNSTGKITITRQALLHYGNSYFIGHFGINIGSLAQFSVQYADMTYGDGVTFQPCYGFYLTRNNARPDYIASAANIGPAFTPVWDTWFNEKVTYDPATGVMEYFINGVSKGTYNVGALPPTNSTIMSLTFSAWGWYTGHEQLFQNLVVSQQTP
jgi:hypothetical protein